MLQVELKKDKSKNAKDESKYTINKYKIGNTYTQDRQKVHHSIIYVFIKDKTPHEKPRAILMGGGAGAGKSTVVQVYLLNNDIAHGQFDDFVYVSADNIKELIPEYKEYQEEGIKLAAIYVHPESTNIALDLIKRCVEYNYSFIYDGTMSYQPHYENDVLPLLEEKSYTIEGIFVDLDVEESIRRANIRSLKEQRHVEDEVIRSSNYNAPITYNAISDTFAKSSIFNNSGEFPIMVYSRGETGINVSEEELYQVFLEKANNTHDNETNEEEANL